MPRDNAHSWPCGVAAAHDEDYIRQTWPVAAPFVIRLRNLSLSMERIGLFDVLDDAVAKGYAIKPDVGWRATMEHFDEFDEAELARWMAWLDSWEEKYKEQITIAAINMLGGVS